MAQDAIEGFPADVLESETPVILFVSTPVAPGAMPEIKRALSALAAGARRVEGCLTYEVYESPDAAGEILFYERWASGASLAAHQSSPAMAAFVEIAMPHLAGALAVKRLTPLS